MKPLITKLNHFALNTTDGRIQIPFSGLTTAALTIEFWLKPLGLVTSPFAGGSSSAGNMLYFNVSSSGFYRIGYYGSLRAMGKEQVANEWVHFALSFSNGTMTTYVNGVQTLVVTEAVFNVEGWCLGYLYSANTTVFIDYEFDEFRVWNYARTSEQIKENYNKVIRPETGLVTYLKLDSNLLDSSSNETTINQIGTLTYSQDVAPQLEKFKFFTSGTYGSAVYGVGENDHLKPNSRIATTNPTQFTMMAWVKSINITKDQLYLSNASGTYMRIVGSRPFYSLNVPTQTTYTAPVPYLVNDIWYHMCQTFDVNTQTTTYYLDGVNVGSRTVTGATAISLGSSILRLGRFSDGDPRSLEGNMMNVQLWSKCLTLDEINQYRYQIFTLDTPDLICQYPLITDGRDIKGNDAVSYGCTFSKDTPYKNILVTAA